MRIQALRNLKTKLDLTWTSIPPYVSIKADPREKVKMNPNRFVYAINGRVFWIDENIFHIPVLNEIYSVHLVDDMPAVVKDECLNYTVKSTHIFNQQSLEMFPPNDKNEKDLVLLSYQKTKQYKKLCELVNCSFQATLPPVFIEEQDRVEVLAFSILHPQQTDADGFEKHQKFVKQYLDDKKDELKKRYVDTVHALRNAASIKEVETASHKIVFGEINVL